ncbi:MAG: polysaccharide pyruvyl transferase family protein [Lachnospiraceae bacterium]|nr:polysaccharide pyruvyl transferase family protein [Lachnospiraceae bacterium]
MSVTYLYEALGTPAVWPNDIDAMIMWMGGNTGNIVWHEAVKRGLKYDAAGNCHMFDMDNDEINIIIPLANVININDNSLQFYFSQIKQYNSEKVRVTMIGMGAQLTEELNTPAKLVAALPYEQKHALKELSYRCVSIGIRGSVTAECLELMGIRNYRIIGCPSFYGAERMGGYKIKPAKEDKLCVSWGSKDYKNEQYVREFFRKNAKDDDILLMQSMEDFPRTLYENAPLLERHVKSRYPNIAVNSHEIEAYIKAKGRIFFDWDEWHDYLVKEQFSLSVGCRFHGNMMSLLAGIPALWITHDSRTYELCEAMCLPSVKLETARKLQGREEYAGFCVYGDKFYRNYKAMYAYYQDFLRENGINFKNS